MTNNETFWPPIEALSNNLGRVVVHHERRFHIGNLVEDLIPVTRVLDGNATQRLFRPDGSIHIPFTSKKG